MKVKKVMTNFTTLKLNYLRSLMMAKPGKQKNNINKVSFEDNNKISIWFC